MLAGAGFAAVALNLTPARAPTRIMVAVLPFQNLTGDPDQEYLCDGLTEEMIAQLGGLQPSRLAVIARTSAAQYKNTAKRVDEIGRELGVEFVLESSVRRAGDRFRIAAQLIDVESQTHVWAEQSDHEMRDVVELQRDVARRSRAGCRRVLLSSSDPALALRDTRATHWRMNSTCVVAGTGPRTPRRDCKRGSSTF